MTPPNKYCSEHQSLERKELEDSRGGYYAKARHNQWSGLYMSPKWKALRDEKLREEPFCEICGKPATEVHHIQPHNGDPEIFYDEGNLMSICHLCHAKETQKESEARKRASRKLWY